MLVGATAGASREPTNSEVVTTSVATPPAAATITPRDGDNRSRHEANPALERKIRRLWFNDTVIHPGCVGAGKVRLAPRATDSVLPCQSPAAAVKPNKQAGV